MSRTPVREALFRLRNEGFLGVESKLGWYVLPIDFGRLEQLYDLRVVLELASVARLCAQAESASELDALKSIWLVPPAERLTDAHAVGAHDEEFHAALVRAAGNDEMARVHWDVTERIRIIRRLDFTRADRIEATYIEHAQDPARGDAEEGRPGAAAAEDAHRAEQGRGAQDHAAHAAGGARSRGA